VTLIEQKMKKTIVPFIIILILFTIDSVGQEKTKLTGIVTDGHRNRLLGINVVIKGTSIETVTNNCGQFSVPADSEKITLLFHGISYDDMRTYETEIKKNNLTSDTLIFQLGHWKVKNPNCVKIDKKLKIIVIE